jgi:hypothetical protein
MIVPRVQLRVYAPLDSFAAGERRRWQTYVDAGRGLTRAELAEAESGASVARLITGRRQFDRRDAALVRRAGQRVLVCPLDLELRAAVALASFAQLVPPRVLDAFVPDPVHRGRLQQVAATGRTPHILDEPFAPPLHWFLAFEPQERRLRENPMGTAPRVVHLTGIELALDRLERVIDVVEVRIEDGDELLLQLAELVAWLDAFPDDAILELDYGGAVDAFTTQQLRAESCCAALWQAVDALDAGDLPAAFGAYDVASSFWAPTRDRQHAS